MEQTQNYHWPVVPEALEDETLFETWFRAAFGAGDSFINDLDAHLAALSAVAGKPVISATPPMGQSEGDIWYEVIGGDDDVHDQNGG